MKSEKQGAQVEDKPIEQKAGVVAYRLDAEDRVEVLLITARTHPHSWVFPVGTVDPGETLQQAAARECVEESGYIVEVGPILGVIDLDNGDSSQRFTFFAARVVGEVEDYETDRQRRWVPRCELICHIADVFLPVACMAMTRLRFPNMMVG